MKICKSCRKQIEEKATKCPHCQAYQKWNRNPQVLGFIFPLIFIPLIFFNSGLFSDKSFLDYKEKFEVKFLNSSSDSKHNIYTYRISNNTGYKWADLDYQFIGLDSSNEVVTVKTESEYSWKVQPHSESLLSIKTLKDSPAVKWKLKLKDLKSNKFN